MKTLIISLLFSTSLIAQSISIAPNLTLLHGDEYTNMYTVPMIGAQIGFGSQIKLNETFSIQYDAIASFNRFGRNIAVLGENNGQVNGYIKEHKGQLSIGLPIQLRIKANKRLSVGLGGIASYGIISSENIQSLNAGFIGSIYYKSLFIQANYGLLRIEKYRFTNISSIALGLRFKI